MCNRNFHRPISQPHRFMSRRLYHKIGFVSKKGQMYTGLIVDEGRRLEMDFRK